MRIAVVLPELDPSTGGGFTFQKTLLDALLATQGGGHEFVFYVAGDAPGDARFVRLPLDPRTKARHRGLQLVRDFQDRGLGIRRVSGRTWLERSLEERDVDLVWFSTPHAQECGRPFVFTVWDLEYFDQPWWPEVSDGGEWAMRQRHYSRYIPRATAVIVPNESGREQVTRHFGIRPERVLCLPHPTPDVSGEQAAPHALERHGIRRPFVFYPAQYWPHKNHLGALRALKAANERAPEPFELVCVGSDKRNLPHVRALAERLGVADRVHLLGFVDAGDLIAFYRNAHALLYLSFFGPENLPPLEAFSLGCPVVYADIPGAREQLGDAAALVPPADADAAAAAIVDLLEPQRREQAIGAGRDLAATRAPGSYVRGVLDFADAFEPIRGNWP